VVLHSPLLSGVRVLQPNMRYWPGWLDIFPNHLLAPHIKAPVLVLHGTADEVQAWRGMAGACFAPTLVARMHPPFLPQPPNPYWGLDRPSELPTLTPSSTVAPPLQTRFPHLSIPAPQNKPPPR
jgi:hypothetical protein